MNVFVLDNYDSFTFNLVQALGELGATVTVQRNDQITVDEVMAFQPDAIVLSPGPGEPANAGICVALVHRCAGSKTPLLGVCLGHQAIAVAFGAQVVPAPALMHGKTSRIFHDGSGVFADAPNPFDAMRYHSLAVDRTTLPEELRISAWTDDDVVMGLRHTTHRIEGVQFHPESVLTLPGRSLLARFLQKRAATTR